MITGDGIAGSLKVSAGGGIGLPSVGNLFSATGTVTVMFNSMREDVTFQIPDAFLPLLDDGDPTTIVIYGSAPGLDGQRNPDAPATGEIYIQATINAQLTIGGILTANGFIAITVAVDPTGSAYLKIDGAVGVEVPMLGTYNGLINLGVYVGTTPGTTGVVGRIQLTRSSGAIPGLRLNGQFLLEINTFSEVRSIKTFKILETPDGLFAGFDRDAAGNLKVVTQTMEVQGGFRLLMAGDLEIGTLKVRGEVVFRIETAGPQPGVELIVNGEMGIDPIGTVKLTDSGFRIDTTGLVARVQVGLDILSGFKGFSFNATTTLAINTTGRSTVLGNSTVAPGLLVRIDGSISLAGVSGTGYLEIKAAPVGFEVKVGLAFDMGGLAFRADGALGVYGDGFALSVAVTAKADAAIFRIEASRTDPDQHQRLVAAGARGHQLRARPDRQGRAARGDQLRRQLPGRGGGRVTGPSRPMRRWTSSASLGSPASSSWTARATSASTSTAA